MTVAALAVGLLSFLGVANAATAMLTYYNSYPMCCKNSPNYDPKASKEECDDYSGCKYIGDFANGEHLSLSQVKNTPIVSLFDPNYSTMSQWKSKYANKKVRITKNGMTFDAYVKDTCADKDCKGCCTRNAKGKILIDVEFYTAKKYLGSLDAADGSATFTLL